MASCTHSTTAIPRLAFWTSPGPTDLEPAIFDPKFYMLLSGRKRMVFGQRRVEYTAGRYAISSVGVPFTTQVTEASPESPYLGVELALDASLIADLLLEVGDRVPDDAPAIAIADADQPVSDALDRLLNVLSSPGDIPVLAPLFERELCYRLLQGPIGGTLRQVVPGHNRLAPIRTAIEWISANADQPMRVDRLAASVGMSAATFHRHFKSVTGCSPLAYQRHLRLATAREMLITDQTNVTSVAFAVGYANASQFSREYKRKFGVSPRQHAQVVAG